MRIVGGKLSGRSLAVPKTQNIRPTTDRTRESLFNILEHSPAVQLQDARVLDIFAGTGALGLEALSRGAQFALFIEKSHEGRGLLRANIEALGMTGCTKVFKRDATNAGPLGGIAPFHLVFADPPYAKQLGQKAIANLAQQGWLVPGAVVVLEEAVSHLPEQVEGFEKLDQRRYGDSAIGIFQLGQK